MSPHDDPHFRTIVKAILDGRVIPFLGAGFNLPGRPQEPKWEWQLGCEHLPSGGELSAHMASRYGYPINQDKYDLVRVSQYIEALNGSGPLYEELREIFNRNFRVVAQHRFLASLPAVFRARGLTPRYQLIVTTNYDDLLECAFREANEPFDLVSYVAKGESRGRFLHWPPDDEARLIEVPNEYEHLSLQERTVILKIHGAVDRGNEDRDSFVITEDDYIDYLTRTDIAKLIPAKLLAKLRRSHFLFLGYSLRDWNLRVILRRIWGEQRLSYQSWAIQLNPDPLEEKFWNKRGVDIINANLADYLMELNQLVEPQPVNGGQT